MIPLLDISDTLQTIASLVFLFAGILMLVKTIRHTMLKSRVEIEEELRRQSAQADYWRTMDAAVDRLAEAAAEINQGVEDRMERLGKLSSEATDLLARLQLLIEDAEKEERAVRKSTDRIRSDRENGTIIEFKSASEALVRKTHRRIYALFDKGRTIQEISRETGLQIGEIELILALRDRMTKFATETAAGTAS